VIRRGAIAARSIVPWAIAATAVAAGGCGGGVPLLHGAHVLRPGDTTFGAGATARIATIDPPEDSQPAARVLEDLGFGAGVAPVVTGRVGIEGQNEAGLTYAGRTIRLDGRHAFDLGNDWAMSLGVGGSALLPRRDARGRDDAASAYGPGVDVPLLFGTHAGGGIYTVWAGPRLGFEHLRGTIDAELVDDPDAGGRESLDLEGNHVWAGGLVGVRVGFRHVHVAIEVDAAWHHGTGSVGTLHGSFDQVSVAPAGALLLTF
jgi:hypothetical protein